VTTGSYGNVTFTISSAEEGTATITATLDSLSDTSTKTWYTPVATTLTLTPEAAFNQLPNDQTETFTVTVLDQHGFGMSGQVVGLSSTFGALSGSSVTTGSYGNVTFTISSAEEGTATITATLDSLSDTSTKTWYYTLPPTPPGGGGVALISFVVTPESATIVVGGIQQFRALYNGVDVTTSAEWISSNPLMSTVGNHTGLATGVGIGSTQITAYYGGSSASATLNVTAGHTVISVLVVPETATIALGQSQQFEAWAQYAEAGFINVTATAEWASGNITVATISAGNATGIGIGTTGITAKYGNVMSNTATLTVGPAVITGITIDTGGSVEVCWTKQVTAMATYSDGSSKDVTSEVTWNSSDPGIVTIDTTGLATGIAAGNVAITAALDEVSGSAILSVTPSGIVSIVVTPVSASIPVNGEQQFTAIAMYSNGNSADVTAKASWASSEEDVATVAAGLASAQAAGTTDITATFCNVTSNLVTLTVAVGVPWSLIGGIIGGLMALGLILFFLLRRIRLEEPEEA
jgi:hypothetical protein